LLQAAEWDRLYSLGESEIVELSNSNDLGSLMLTHFYSDLKMPTPKSALVVPFKHPENKEDVIIGLLILADQRPNYFSSNDGAYSSLLVNTVAPIILQLASFRSET